MAASSRVPTEVWSQILYSTFDFYLGWEHPINRFDAWPESRVEDYWATEKQRCLLRLVCKTWKECVDRRQHRLLEMWDFVYHKMGDEILLKAERILFRLPRYCGHWNCRGCEDRDIMKWLDGVTAWAHDDGIDRPQWEGAHLTKLTHIFFDFQSRHSGDLRVQAIDIDVFINIDDLISAAQMIHLSIISLGLVPANVSPRDIYQISLTFPRLVHLKLSAPFIIEDTIDNDIEFLYLESFYLTISANDLTDYRFSSWRLPRLKHLQISSPPKTPEQLIELLGPHSGSLRSLYFLFHQPASFSLDKQLWDLFPRLESMNWLPSLEKILYLPDESHPLSTFVLNPHPQSLRYSSLVERVHTLLEKGRLRLKFLFPWDTFCRREGDYFPANYRHRCDWHIDINQWARMGIEIVDINNEPW